MSNNQVKKIFDDLEKFRNFCVDFGYKFDESALYNMRSYAFQQYSKFASGKMAKNMWVEDAKRYDAALNSF